MVVQTGVDYAWTLGRRASVDLQLRLRRAPVSDDRDRRLAGRRRTTHRAVRRTYVAHAQPRGRRCARSYDYSHVASPRTADGDRPLTEHTIDGRAACATQDVLAHARARSLSERRRPVRARRSAASATAARERSTTGRRSAAARPAARPRPHLGRLARLPPRHDRAARGDDRVLHHRRRHARRRRSSSARASSSTSTPASRPAPTASATGGTRPAPTTHRSAPGALGVQPPRRGHRHLHLLRLPVQRRQRSAGRASFPTRTATPSASASRSGCPCSAATSRAPAAGRPSTLKGLHHAARTRSSRPTLLRSLQQRAGSCSSCRSSSAPSARWSSRASCRTGTSRRR